MSQQPTHFVRDDILPGAGSGTFLDPWNIEDVMQAANPKAIPVLTGGVGVITDGTVSTAYQIAVGITTPTSLITVGSCDSITGQWTNKKAFIDGTLMVSGDVYSQVNTSLRTFNLVFYNGPEVGGVITAVADRSTMIGCISHSNGTYGFEIANGAEGASLEYCTGYDNVDNGVTVLGSQASSYNILYRSVFFDNGDADIFLSDSGQTKIYQCIVKNFRQIGNFTNGLIQASVGNSRTTIMDTTVYHTGTASNIVGLTMISTEDSITINNIFKGSSNYPAIFYAIGLGPDKVTAGNVYDGVDGLTATVAIAEFDAGSNIDPDFVSATDLTPQANLSGLNFPSESIWEEAAHLIPGALEASGGGGGGGGGGYRPKIAIGA